MLSFSGFLKILMQKQIAKSLQVPCIFPHKDYGNLSFPEKRALPFTSAKAERISASMTIEAALCLPLFLFFAAALMEPMRWLDRQRKVQTVTERLCEDLSQYVYINELGEAVFHGWNGDIMNGEKDASDNREDRNYQGLLSDTAAGLWLKGKAAEYADDVVVKKSNVSDESGNVWFEIVYREQIPFFQIKPDGISMHAAAKRRSWIGIDGKLRAKGKNGGETGNSEETIVYVGAGMGRYHLYRNCHYISNQYQTIPFSQAEQMRNTAGGRYTACARCAKAGKSESYVYITEAGEHYHYSKSCSAMTAYVRSMTLKEAGHLGICSYCARKKAGGE